MADSGATLYNLSTESRSFPPSAEFAAQANATEDWYARADADREGFWAEQAERLTWARAVGQGARLADAPFAKWFVGGKLNVAYNCVDRHVEAGHGDQVAFHWEGEPGDAARSPTPTCSARCAKAANALDRARGAAGRPGRDPAADDPRGRRSRCWPARGWAPCTASCSAGSRRARCKARIEDAEAKLLITSDGQFRRGKPAPMKENTDEAVADTPTIEHVLVVRRTETEVPWTEGRDVWWHEIVDRQSDTHEAEAFDAETPAVHPLHLRAPRGSRRASCTPPVATSPRRRTPTTSCSTTSPARASSGAPPTSAGSPGTATSSTGRWPTGPRRCMYEGTPNTPHEGRHWEIIQKYGVSIYYTAPDADPHVHEVGQGDPGEVRPVLAAGARQRRRADQPRGLDVVPGEHRPQQVPDRRHLVADRDRRDHDRAAAGRHRRASRARRCARCPGSAPRSSPRRREPVGPGGGGYLVLDKPWPSMLRGIWGDEERYRDTYWSRFAEQGYYFAGDGAKYDDDGAIWLLGRVDDVMNVSGHRISTTEVESALVSHPTVAEAAVVGATDATTGQGIVAFVILRGNAAQDEAQGRGSDQGAARPRRQGDRPDRQAAPDHGRRGAAEDPLRQDHATAAARRRREPRGRRRHDAGRLVGDGPDLRRASTRASRRTEQVTSVL